MDKVALINLGCARNLVDSETLLSYIKQAGFDIEEDWEKAQVGIINTCAFINEAKQESIDIILDAVYLKKRKLEYIVVVGCLAQRYSKQLYNEIGEIDAVISPCYYSEISTILKKVVRGERVYKVGLPGVKNDFFGRRNVTTPHSYTYLKISDGCDNFCSYCNIPYIRGRYIQRDINSLLKELKQIRVVSPNMKEVNLVAQDTTLYGYEENYSLVDLLRAIGECGFVKWIRILYSHPEHFNDKLIEEISNNSKVCRYIDLPIQHISNNILKRMNRKIKQNEIMDLINKIRKRLPEASIRTTLMVGFPGESEDDFQQLMRFVKKMEFEKLGVFKYSKEEGTPAYSFSDHISDEIKTERFNQIMEIQKNISKKKLERFLDKKMKLLVDSIGNNENEYLCRTEFDAPEVDGQVFLNVKNKYEVGDMVESKIIGTMEYDLVAEDV